MRPEFADLLRCPSDGGALDLTTDAAEDGHVIRGSLLCRQCAAGYAIRDGVPDLVPGSMLDANLAQDATVSRFGFEWLRYRDWGWLAEYPDVPNAEEVFSGGLIENTVHAFRSKGLFAADELGPGLRVLDAGCGNGRFTHQAARTGAEVVGVDLGQGVAAAFGHLSELPNVHVARADLFRLPFARESFDRIFSIGVLQHTGDGPAAFASLARLLRPGGLIVAHVYGRGRRLYEWTDAALRAVTTRLPLRGQLLVAKAFACVARGLRGGPEWKRNFYDSVYSVVNLLPTEHHMFDWWSAPIAHHYEPGEVGKWFENAGLEVLRTNPPFGDARAEATRRYRHASVTVLGRRPPT